MVYERLKSMCFDAGQTKTRAVERALEGYLDVYDENKKRLKELDD